MSHALTSLLGNVENLVGWSSLAAGADQVFATVVLSLGGTLEVVVPSDDYETSFKTEPDLVRYRELLRQAGGVQELSFPEPSEDAYLAAGQRIADRCDVLVAVWDGLPAEGRGGTADIVAYAHQLGKPVHVIWPEGVERRPGQ